MTRRSGRRRRSGKRAAAQSAAPSQSTRQMLGTAIALHRRGEISRARSLYEEILEREPRNADALQFLGLVYFHSGDPGRARELIESAISENPRVAPYHDNLGSVLENQGELEAALRAFEDADALEPAVASRRFNMGVVLQRMGRLEDAERCYRDAIGAEPNDSDYHFNLGNLLKAQARYAEAIDAYRLALSINPQAAQARNNLGNALLSSGDAVNAAEAFREAIARSPSDARLHHNLGNALRELGDLQTAEASYRRALEIDTASVGTLQNLGSVLLLAGRLDEATRAFLKAFELSPESSQTRRGLVSAVRHLEIDAYDPALCAAIGSCIDAEDVYPQDLARVAAEQLCRKHGIDAGGARSPEEAARALAGDKFALRLLETTVNVDPVLEGVLTGIRRWLFSYAGADLSEPPLLDFTCALAQQCFTNEFVFAESEAEAAALSAQISELNDALAGDVADESRLPGLVALVALYRPLSGLDSAAALASRWESSTWPAPMGALIEQALLAPWEEARLGAEIPRATGITNGTSVAVKAQYEQNPYPRWLAVPRHEKRAYGRFLSRRFPHFEAPPRLDEAVNVLVAGCGTGQEAVAVATGRVCARVTAVDLSRPSLAYGLRMARALGVSNLDFREADVLELASLGERYEVVESSGVLHHLADPLAGLKALSECLVPGGVMKIGLYSQRARAAVVAARQAIREAGLAADAEGIRRIRTRIFEAAAQEPLRELAGSEDLYTTSACRDLLFHVCEHRFTPAQIGEALEALALGFIGFELPYPFVGTQYLAFNPGDKEMRDLDAWTRFEAHHPDTFAAMYVFWCCKPE